MIALIKTKWRYRFLLLLLLSSLTVFSQNKKLIGFKDFPSIQNLDSFELALNQKKNNLEQYLQGLITLEKIEKIIQVGLGKIWRPAKYWLINFIRL